MSRQPENSRLDLAIRVLVTLLFIAVVLALYTQTGNPAGHIKILIYSLAAAVLVSAHIIGTSAINRPLKPTPLFRGLLTALLLVLLSATCFSANKGNSLAELSNFVALFLLYFIAAQIYRKPGQVHWLMLALCCAVGVSVCYGFVQRYAPGLDPFPWDASGIRDPFAEMPGTFGNGNLAAHATILSIVMAVYLATTGRHMWLCLLFAPLLLAHMHFTDQRGGIIGALAAVALLASAGLLRKRLKRPNVTIVASVFVVFLCALVAGAGTMAVKKVRTGVAYPIGKPVLLRYHGYSGAVRLIQESPVVGHGPGSYLLENPRYWTTFEKEHYAVDRKMNNHVHNDVLELGVEGGLVAAGLYLSFLMAATYYGLLMALTDGDAARRRMGCGFAAFFCTYMVDGFFGFNLRAPVTAAMLFVMAGALEGVWRTSRAPNSEDSCEPARVPQYLLRGAVLALALFAAIMQTRIFTAERLLQQGRGAIHWQAYPQAEEILAEGEPYAPWNWDFAYQRGRAALYRNDPNRAVTHFERSLSRNPSLVGALTGLARANMQLATTSPPPNLTSPAQVTDWRLQHLMRVTDFSKKALALCDVLPEAEELLGRSASVRASILQAGQSPPPAEVQAIWAEAIEHFSRSVDFRAKNLDQIYHMVATAYQALGNEQAALDAFVRATDANPANIVIWSAFHKFAAGTGRTAVLRARLSRGIDQLRTAQAAVPPALDALATAWRTDGEGSGLLPATAVLAKAATSGPPATDDATGMPSLNLVADILVEQLRTAGLSDQETASALYNLAAVYATTQTWDNADSLFRASWPFLRPNLKKTAAIKWAQVLNVKGNHGEAASVLQQVLPEVRASFGSHQLLASTLALAGKRSEALNEYRRILQLHTLSPQIRQGIELEINKLSP